MERTINDQTWRSFFAWRIGFRRNIQPGEWHRTDGLRRQVQSASRTSCRDARRLAANNTIYARVSFNRCCYRVSPSSPGVELNARTVVAIPNTFGLVSIRGGSARRRKRGDPPSGFTCPDIDQRACPRTRTVRFGEISMKTKA